METTSRCTISSIEYCTEYGGLKGCIAKSMIENQSTAGHGKDDNQGSLPLEPEKMQRLLNATFDNTRGCERTPIVYEQIGKTVKEYAARSIILLDPRFQK